MHEKPLPGRQISILLFLCLLFSGCRPSQPILEIPDIFVDGGSESLSAMEDTPLPEQLEGGVGSEPATFQVMAIDQESQADNAPRETALFGNEERFNGTIRTSLTPLPPDAWKTLPVIPSVSDAARDIYTRGLAMGNDPHSFSKIGDCQSITTYFLAYFDLPGYYQLGDYLDLQETIDWFKGSFKRESLEVKGGFNAAAILSPLRANRKVCLKG